MSLTSRKSILITGCSTGSYGEELAKQFHEKGLLVIATARNESSMAPLQGLGIHTLALDVTNSKSIDAAKEKVTMITNGKLNILFNNAGTCYKNPLIDSSMEHVRDMFEVNFFGPMAMVQKFVPLLIASGDGRIVQMGSIAGLMPGPWIGAYNASKAALHAFGDTLRVELAPFNVKVLTIPSGIVKSNFTNAGQFECDLPPNSVYQPIREEYMKSNTQVTAVDSGPPAKRIVIETLKPQPRAWLWVGGKVWTCWIITTFFGRRGFDKRFSKMFGLAKLAKILRVTKAST